MSGPDSAVGTLTLTRSERISARILGSEQPVSHGDLAGFTRFVLICDETAIPALARWIELLPNEPAIIALVELTDETAARYLEPAHVNRAKVCWLTAGDGALGRAVRNLGAIPAETYIWAAGKDTTIDPILHYLRDEVRVAERQLDIGR